MSDEQQVAGGVTPPATSPTSSDGETAKVSKDDWVGWAKANRKALEGVESVKSQVGELGSMLAAFMQGQQGKAPAAPTQQASAPAQADSTAGEIAQLRATVENMQRSAQLESFFNNNQIKDAKNREVFQRMLATAKPDQVAADAAALLDSMRAVVGQQPSQDAGKAQPTPPAAALPKGSSASPAFQRSDLSGLRSGTIFQQDPAMTTGMTLAEKFVWAEQDKARSSNQNPWAMAQSAVKQARAKLNPK